ncbi:hypothetical protein BC834DRAFT_286945 [Gloeopeniophorella convolvens]|nr:hypothetical protein BC834DRAFT_286945 [Gloeopeniophorella convolvens]
MLFNYTPFVLRLFTLLLSGKLALQRPRPPSLFLDPGYPPPPPTMTLQGSTPTVGNTIGAVTIGWGMSSLVFGMLCVQVWTYYQRYPNDHISYKLLVLALWALEALHQAFIGHLAWFYTIQNFGNASVIRQPPVWTLSVQIILGVSSRSPVLVSISDSIVCSQSFIGCVVKICFGMRVWKFSNKNYMVTGLIMGMALAQLGAHFAQFHKLPILMPLFVVSASAFDYTIRSFHVQVIEARKIKTIGSTALTLGMATDIVTAGALSYFLHKMRTGYAKSDTLINRLILYSVNTGILTSACSVAVLVTYNIMPANFIFIGFYFVLCKLYANSCVATLNTRRFVHGKGTDREDATMPTFLMIANPFSRSRGEREPKSDTHLEIGVHQQQISVTSESDKIPQYAQAW